MIISWYGEGCFKLQNGDKTVLMDVPSKDSGISAPKIKTNILIKTITAWPDKGVSSDKTFVVRGAGEYDVNGIKIRGKELSSESGENFFKTVYTLDWDGIKFGLLGHIEKNLTPNVLEIFEDLDVVIAPGGGEPFIGQKEVIALIKQLNPKIFIPSFFKIKGLKRKSGEVKDLIKLFNGEIKENQEKIVMKKKDFQEIKKTKLICLKV